MIHVNDILQMSLKEETDEFVTKMKLLSLELLQVSSCHLDASCLSSYEE
jgi:hypothetical protein